MRKNDGGPAFPVVGDYMEIDPDDMKEKFSGLHFQAPGMALRDYFAGQALAGMISGNILESYMNEANITGMEEVAKAHATRAYLFADAMLAERAR